MIEHLSLTNWRTFRGHHEVDFSGRRFVAIIGNNGWGKSSVMSAILFALYGRTSTGDSAQDQITWGEESSSIRLRVGGPSPFTITRSIARDGSVSVEMSGIEDARTRDVAKEVEERIGLSFDDLTQTAFVRQAHLLGLAEAGPAELRQKFARWTDRKEWSVLEERARKALETLDREMTIVQTCASVAVPDLAALRAELEAVRATVVEPDVDLSHVAEIEDEIRALESRMAEIEREGRELKGGLLTEEQREKIIGRRDAAQKALGVAESERKKLRILREEGFAGECPIVPLECPVKEKINRKLEVESIGATKRRMAIERSAYEEKEKIVNACAELAADNKDAARIDALRKEYAEKRDRLCDAEDELQEAEQPKADPKAIEERARRIGALEQQISAAELMTRSRDEAAKQLDALRRKRAALAYVLLGVSRSGIPALESASDLARIEADASAILSDLGAGFGVAFRQEKELKTWASTCYACGDLVDGKTCGACGAPRERKRKDELRVVATFPKERECALNAHSGGGQTFVALALRIAAFRLLRRRRGAAWSVLVLDEVRRALSADNARLVSQAIAHALGDGISVVFDVVHGSEQSAADSVLEAVAEPNGSSLRWAR